MKKPLYYYVKTKGSLVDTQVNFQQSIRTKRILFDYYKDLYKAIDLYEENKLRIQMFYLSFAHDKTDKIKRSSRRKADGKELMKEVKTPKKPLAFYYMLVIVVMLLLNSFLFPRLLKQQVEDVDYGTFLNMIDEKQVSRVQIDGDYIYFVDNKEETGYYRTATFDDPELVDRLQAAGCEFGRVVEEEMSPILSFLISWVLPIVLFVVIGQWISSK